MLKRLRMFKVSPIPATNTLPARVRGGNKMNAANLKYQVLNADPNTHFFDSKTMRFFGDTMRNFGVRSARVRTNYDDDGNYTTAEGAVVECWELYRRHAVKHGLKSSHFFNKETFKSVSGEVVA